MISSDLFSNFCSVHYDEARHFADIAIGSIVKKNGPLNPKYDVESIKSLAVINALETAFVKYNPEHEKKARLSTYLSKLVFNGVITELGKEKTAIDRFEGFKSRKKPSDEQSKYSTIIPEARMSGARAKKFEPHDYMDIFSSKKGKEKQIREIMRKFRQLPPLDQLVLTFWMNEEITDREYYLRGEEPKRTYVERILDELHLDESAANAVTIRCFRAKKKLKALMMDVPSDYENIYVPGSSNWKSYGSHSGRCIKIYTDDQYNEIEKVIIGLE